MFFTIFDLILLLILFIFISFSFWMGLIQTLGGIVGLFAGAWIGGMYYEQFAVWLNPYFMDHPNVARIVAFILIFTLVNRLVGLIFWLINKVFNVISMLPFLKSINRIGGALLGFVEGVLILGAIILMINRFPIGEWVMGIIGSSQVATWLEKIADIVISPLLPDIAVQIQNVI
ncbi:CvpA family protein [Patescibacteria group bacterium]|nr:CvpA family protein [Patescibacteria group bacterium]